MVMKMNAKHTIYASFVGYITQAIVNNLAPLLFSIYMVRYGFDLKMIAFVMSFNFITQLIVDFLAAKYVDYLGYRLCIVAAHFFSAFGLIGLSIFPEWFSNPYLGILCSVFLYAIGGGLIEVLISPIVEACPTKNKASIMSLLHSFYCWGCVLVVGGSSLFFYCFGKSAGMILPILWAIIPIINAFVFMKVPLYDIVNLEDSMRMRDLFKEPIFYVLLGLMICAGASEQAMSQWASTYVELSLELPKSLGDLVGPCFFSIMMGLSRVFYAKFGEKINLHTFIKISGILCILSYIGASRHHAPILNLLSCGLCGLSVGILWPGIFSIAASTLKKGGTAMFGLLALCGDVGCALGPWVVGQMAKGSLLRGMTYGMIFPIVLIILCYTLKRILR